jgi:hypothetical protein
MASDYKHQNHIMRFLIIPAILTMIIVACGTKARENKDPENTTPETLQENSSKKYETGSKRRSQEDLLEDLYRELESKDTALLQMAAYIPKLEDKKEDSLKAFSEFSAKNDAYYRSARVQIERIRSTALKQLATSLVTNSLQQYDNRVATHKQWVTLLAQKEQELRDQFVLLKITRTLYAMEAYQLSDLPSLVYLQHLGLEFDKLIQRSEALRRK